MPRRNDIKRILIIGSGPIVIGQACEFDYSGTQACQALKADGYEVVLVNSNPATIMTDPDLSYRTYVEPITLDIVEKVIVAEKPDALLPTMGGQTALNVAIELFDGGVLKRHGVELIGAQEGAIHRAEDRKIFKDTMIAAGLDVPKSREVTTIDQAIEAAEELGFPLIMRPAFTLGGAGGGIAFNADELREKIELGLEWSPIGQVLVEESVLGWKEFELEVMRDKKDNCVIVCSIENFDPMGVHTGDSITVAPAQTLSDREYQRMRDWSITIMRAIGVETGGSNIQFAVDPRTGRLVVIEMNPRVSRSSALASKATGFPIAKIAARLAVGYTLDEIPNDITGSTPASFEPTIDYVVTKMPRFAFEKFPDVDQVLDTKMRSVGEVMAMGGTFKESLQKAMRSLENGLDGLDSGSFASAETKDIRERIAAPYPDRILAIREALARGISIDEIRQMSGIDPWFLGQLSEIVSLQEKTKRSIRGRGKRGVNALSSRELRDLKRVGMSDVQIARYLKVKPGMVEEARRAAGIKPVFKMVDTCAAEFEARTPYLYSTYADYDEAPPTPRRKVAILGSGPNRIGQGVEFDYCCVHAAYALREEGYEVIMINCNPETVSTDYDTSDRLYFEPLTHEDIMAILERENRPGVIVQLGGQTPLKLAKGLVASGITILGTSCESIDMAEDRKEFDSLLSRLGLDRPEAGTVFSIGEALDVARRIGYPVLVRPSYVLGGRAMNIVYDDGELDASIAQAVKVSPDHPVLIDDFLEDAIEVDVDCVADGSAALVIGVMEHIEEAGIHSGDSAMVLPPHTLKQAIVDRIKDKTIDLALALAVKGLMNVQYAVKGEKIYVLEVNPRASRTVPFVSKVTGLPWAKIATKIMVGKTLADQRITSVPSFTHMGVKESVFPFDRFFGSDIVLGPEMKSTGEVMGIDSTFGAAFAKSQIAAGQALPSSGNIFISVKDKDKPGISSVARELVGMGFGLFATEGTARLLVGNGIAVTKVPKVHEGGRPNVLDLIKNGEIRMIIDSPQGKGPRSDNYAIRCSAVVHRIPSITTMAGARAIVSALASMRAHPLEVKPLQDYHAASARASQAAKQVGPPGVN